CAENNTIPPDLDDCLKGDEIEMLFHRYQTEVDELYRKQGADAEATKELEQENRAVEWNGENSLSRGYLAQTLSLLNSSATSVRESPYLNNRDSRSNPEHATYFCNAMRMLRFALLDLWGYTCTRFGPDDWKQCCLLFNTYMDAPRSIENLKATRKKLLKKAQPLPFDRETMAISTSAGPLQDTPSHQTSTTGATHHRGRTLHGALFPSYLSLCKRDIPYKLKYTHTDIDNVASQPQRSLIIPPTKLQQEISPFIENLFPGNADWHKGYQELDCAETIRLALVLAHLRKVILQDYAVLTAGDPSELSLSARHHLAKQHSILLSLQFKKFATRLWNASHTDQSATDAHDELIGEPDDPFISNAAVQDCQAQFQDQEEGVKVCMRYPSNNPPTPHDNSSMSLHTIPAAQPVTVGEHFAGDASPTLVSSPIPNDQSPAAKVGTNTQPTNATRDFTQRRDETKSPMLTQSDHFAVTFEMALTTMSSGFFAELETIQATMTNKLAEEIEVARAAMKSQRTAEFEAARTDMRNQLSEEFEETRTSINNQFSEESAAAQASVEGVHLRTVEIELSIRGLWTTMAAEHVNPMRSLRHANGNYGSRPRSQSLRLSEDMDDDMRVEAEEGKKEDEQRMELQYDSDTMLQDIDYGENDNLQEENIEINDDEAEVMPSQSLRVFGSVWEEWFSAEDNKPSIWSLNKHHRQWKRKMKDRTVIHYWLKRIIVQEVMKEIVLLSETIGGGEREGTRHQQQQQRMALEDRIEKALEIVQRGVAEAGTIWDFQKAPHTRGTIGTS
ncbi:hypothetical protein BG015_005889, partial [Linnemannia schmuckeri]